MKLLDNIIEQLLNKYIGGQDYFTALDKSIQHKLIIDKLFSIAPVNNIIILSGGFGKFIQRLYPNKQLLVLNGGLRHLERISLEHIANKIKRKDTKFQSC